MTDTDYQYDPTENPRYLDPEDHAGVPITPAQLEEAWSSLGVLSQVIDLTAMDGWQHVVATIEAERRSQRSQMERADDVGTLKFRQGAVATLSWLLDLPDKWVKEQRRLSDLTAQAEVVED